MLLNVKDGATGAGSGHTPSAPSSSAPRPPTSAFFVAHVNPLCHTLCQRAQSPNRTALLTAFTSQRPMCLSFHIMVTCVN